MIVETPGGKKNKRRIDASFIDPKTGEIVHFQVGVANKRGDGIAREREAIDDIVNFGGTENQNVYFIPYKTNFKSKE